MLILVSMPAGWRHSLAVGQTRQSGQLSSEAFHAEPESNIVLWSSNLLFDFLWAAAYIGSGSLNGQSHRVGGVTASTEMLAAKRHAGVHTPVIACKTIIANQ